MKYDHTRHALHPAYRRQSGVVLLISMIALVALTLVGLALARTVATTNEIAGNILFRQSSVGVGDRAVDNAIQTVLGTLVALDGGTGQPYAYANPAAGIYRYQAAMLPTEYTAQHPAACTSGEERCVHSNGIPNLLTNTFWAAKSLGLSSCKSAANASTLTSSGYMQSTYDVRSGNCYSYVIDRLCLAAGDPKAPATRCATLDVKGEVSGYAQSQGSNTGGQSGDSEDLNSSNTIAYRVTIRVDGPRGTTAYMQAIINSQI